MKTNNSRTLNQIYERKINDFLEISREILNPVNFSKTLFSHYSIPAFDNNKKPSEEFGNEIKSNKLKVFHDSILVSKLNPKIPRIWRIKNCAQNAVCSTEFIVLRPIKPEFRKFLDYFTALFQSKKFYNFLAKKPVGLVVVIKE